MIADLFLIGVIGTIAIAVVLEVGSRILDRYSEHLKRPLTPKEDAAARIRSFELAEKLRDEAEQQIRENSR